MTVSKLIAAGARRPDRAGGNARAAIVAARDLATEAGASILGAGGNAADAAVAVAGALAVVDCANCGIGGFGGFAVIDRGAGDSAMQIGFNARVPRGYRGAEAATGRPGALVSPPAVVAGLAALQDFGRLGAGEAWAPAIRLAREGFGIGKDLARALRWAAGAHEGLNQPFRELFFRDGEPLRQGDRLVQPRLAETLERIAADGAAAMRSGPVVDAIVRTARGAGGCLEAEDFASLQAQVGESASCEFEGATIRAPEPQQCGAGILFGALDALRGDALGEPRSERYLRAMAGALAGAWRDRHARHRAPSPAAAQTTHLCVADRDGMMVSMTFTHGPAWFGSGLLDAETGILLNTGASIFSRRTGDGSWVALPNVTPVIVRRGAARYAIGSPGGRHIPAIVFQAIVDLVHYGASPDRVLGEPRMSADADGNIDAEAALRAAFPKQVRREIGLAEYYGPAGMIAWEGGSAAAFRDPRFDGACAHVA